ncbi:GroES-like protein [Tilletiaria anomala UBC 951]|uniref:GroES-like protein n=1 Tax=Tilletiaria anomala (strain ATCC 24038 / CBS 436.72 / UBC 951) TaxID=1037660 RepID=A0A066VLP6_TILAU|nr:GroES-like protein [Tilletiaria anomala UBC 951]KDN39689.1 GroES-like protein [Tilletiaria anomala UBC 951]
MASSGTMKAVVFKGPNHVVVEQRPIPQVQDDTDAVVKVVTSGLCGSDLHIYRGHQPVSHHDFILGHEFVGTIHKVGPGVKSFKEGDLVLSPFTISCGDCFYCTRSQTGRCVRSKVFGSVPLEGAQAEYVLVPLAETSLYHAPQDVPKELLVLLADIVPTGYFACKNAWDRLSDEERKDATCVVIGNGPVGLCAVSAAAALPFKRIFAVDSIPQRLEQAKKHGAHQSINFQSEDVDMIIKGATGGRGADVILEVVGAEAALQMAIKLARPFGVISSVGVHTHSVTLSGPDLYNKNLRLSFGRCPVRAVFVPALKLLQDNVDLFKNFVQHVIPIDSATEYYKLFNEGKILKTVFEFK